jgi:hypothetical protein
MKALIPKGFPLVFLLVLTFTLGLGGVTMVQAVDNQTPANEGACDVLLAGSTPGLYGLCVAYCEALDCHRQFDGNTACNNPPSPKILENYNRLKQEDDPIMPCRREGCPCFNEADLNNFDPRLDLCSNDLDLQQPNSVTCTQLNADRCYWLSGFIGGATIGNIPGRGPTCMFAESNLGTTNFVSVTLEEAQICDDLLQARGSAFGWDCFQ